MARGMPRDLFVAPILLYAPVKIIFKSLPILSTYIGDAPTKLPMTTVYGPQLHEDFVSEGSLGGDSNHDEERAVGNCGIGPWRLRCLQIFAKPIWFMLLLNTYCCVEGAIVSGKIIIMLPGGQHMPITN